MTCKKNQPSVNYFSGIYSYYTEPIVSFTNSSNHLLVQLLILPKHISQKNVSLYNICTVPIPADMELYLGNIHEYTQMHIPYQYITMSLDSFLSLMKPQLKLLMHVGEVYYCKNACLLVYISEYTCASVI